MIEASAPKPSPLRVLLAWGVHLLTASGAVIGAAALVAVARGDLTRRLDVRRDVLHAHPEPRDAPLARRRVGLRREIGERLCVERHHR